MQLMAPLDVGVVGGGGFSLRREEFPHRPRRTVSCALLPLLLQRGGCQSVRDVTVMILLLRTVYVHVSYSCTRVGTSRRVVQERSAKSVWSPLFDPLALVRSHKLPWSVPGRARVCPLAPIVILTYLLTYLSDVT